MRHEKKRLGMMALWSVPFLMSGCFGKLDLFQVGTKTTPTSSGTLSPTKPASTTTSLQKKPAAPTPPGLAGCALSPAEVTAASTLLSRTEDAVHELVTCGGAQIQLAKSMLVGLFVSNPTLFAPESYAQLTKLLTAFGLLSKQPFVRAPDGVWEMNLAAQGDSWFNLTFHAPKDLAGQTALLEDPFTLDSYLVGATVETSMSYPEMMGSPSKKNHFAFHWKSLGPLSHVLNAGTPLPNPVTFEASLMDFASLALGKKSTSFGAFESLASLVVASDVAMDVKYDSVSVVYEAKGKVAAIGEVAASGAVAFAIDGLSSRLGTHALVAETSQLVVKGKGSLAGTIAYRFEGAAGAAIAVSDFGSGAAYPVITWRCAPLTEAGKD